MHSLAFFLLLFVGLACGGHVPVRLCGSRSRARLEYIDVERCNSAPCVIERGRLTDFSVGVIPYVNSSTLTLDATFLLFDIEFPIPGVVSNLCRFVTCPIVAGRTYRATQGFYIRTWAPPMRTTVTYRVYGDDWEELGCLTTNITIV
ncbi:mite group 2 allergen-like Ixo r 2 [Ornithodoros turicata]|uniref:mite group 2 allergen-like Ixo r 2 n=1 Tax=Ornithodoros turicata TaxID=34597 RepID=UPI003138E364